MADTLTVGEVQTFFEGFAEGLFKVIEQIEKKLENLTKKKFEIEVGLEEDLGKDVERGIDRIIKQVAKVEDRVEDAFDSVQKAANNLTQQVSQATESTIETVTKKSALLIETVYTRAFAAIGLTIITFGTKAGEAFAVSLAAAEGLVATVTAFSSGTVNFLLTQTDKLFLTIIQIQDITASIFTFLGGGALATLSSFVAKTGLLGGTFLAYSIFFTETRKFLRRIVGLGFNVITPIERVTRLVTTLDASVNQIGGTVGQLFKTATFGIAAFFGPFSGIIAGIPFINSLVTSILNFGAVFRLSILASFGSARAQLQLVFVQAKAFLVIILPVVLKLAKQFRGNIFTRFFNLTKLSKLKSFIAGIFDEIKRVAKIIETTGNTVKTLLPQLVPKKAAILSPEQANLMQRYRESLGLVKAGTIAVTESIAKMGQAAQTTGQQFAATRLAGFTKALQIDRLRSIEPVIVKIFRTLSGEKISGAQQAKLAGLLNEINKLTLGTKPAESFELTFRKIVNTLGDLGKVAGVTRKEMKPLREGLKQFSIEKLNFPAITLAFKQLRDTIGATGGIGTTFFAQLKQSLEKTKGEVSIQAQAFAKLIATVFAGPRIKEAGAKIPLLIGQGVVAGEPQLKKAMGSTLKGTVADLLPQSPPLIGPLVNIVQMGFKIPQLIAEGIIKGGSLIKNAISKVLGFIVTSVQKIRDETKEFQDIFLIGRQTGVSTRTISALNFALKGFGGSVSDIVFSFRRLTQNINAAFTDTNLQQKFQDLGINIKEVAQTTEPATELFLRLSDVINKSGPASVKGREALSRLSAIGLSPIAKLAGEGRTEIERLLKQAVKAGAIVDPVFARLSSRFVQVVNLIETIKSTLKKDILEVVLPSLEKTTTNVFNLILRNRQNIQVFLAVVAKSFLAVGEALSLLFQKIIADPKAAFEELKFLAQVSLDFAKVAVFKIFEVISINTQALASTLFLRLKIIIANNMADILNFVLKQSIAIGSKLKTFFANFSKSIFQSIFAKKSRQKTVDEIAKVIEESRKRIGLLEPIHPLVANAVAIRIINRENIKGLTTLQIFLQEIRKDSEETFQKMSKDLKVSLSEPGFFLDTWANEIRDKSAQIQNDIKKTNQRAARETSAVFGKIGIEFEKFRTTVAAKEGKTPFVDLFRQIQAIIDGIGKTIEQTRSQIGATAREAGKTINDIPKKAVDAIFTRINGGLQAVNAFLKENRNEFQKSTNEFVQKFKDFDAVLKDIRKAQKEGGIGPRFTEGLERTTTALNKLKKQFLGDLGLSEAQKLTNEFKEQISILEAAKSEGGDIGTLEQKINLLSIDYTKKLHAGTLSALNSAFDSAFDNLLESGTVTLGNLADIGKNLFQTQAKSLFETLKKSLTDTLTEGLVALGAGPGIASLVQGITAGIGLLLSRIKGTASVVNTAIKDGAVESAKAMRGVIAGVEQIGILEVSQRLVTGIAPLVTINRSILFEVRAMRITMESIDARMSGGTDLTATF